MTAWIILVIVVCSIVQSVFGMGILVFGTPTLLLLGLGYDEVLSILVPASITISVLQLIGRGRPKGSISPHLWTFCVPVIIGGLLFSIVFQEQIDIRKIVGVVLILSVATISHRSTREFLIKAVKRHSALFHAVMGLIHGVSNMGGSLLSIYAACVGTDKDSMRQTVAFYYLVFGVGQVIVLLALSELSFSYNLGAMLLSGAIYLAFGNRVFERMPEMLYKSVFPVFMIAYGVVLLAY